VATSVMAFVVPLGIAPPDVDRPRLDGFNFVGGLTVSPELTALLAALVLHHAAHISEVVRGAVLAVPSRQRDAAYALGLSRAQTMRFVVIPQALRAMVPLLATNCVSLTKNSSLAVAIGFPDLVSILNTTANQTGHAIETMLIMIVVYLTLSLVVAAAMNAYNRRLLRPGA
jgi:general L-amino acid transport system permease protein